MDLSSINEIQYVDWKVKAVMNIKDKYGFRIILIMSDGTQKIQQKSGFLTKAEANNERNNVIAELINRTYIINERIKTSDFITFWLENIMKPKIANNTYVTYSNSVYKYIVPNIGNIYLKNLNRGHIQKLYKVIFSLTQSGVRIAKTILKTAFDFAIIKKLMKTNPVKDVKFPKEMKSKPYRVLNIDSSKTLTLEQVKTLIEASEGTKINMQIIFAALMGLRRSEINGLKYSDVDYIHRKLKVSSQIAKRMILLLKHILSKKFL